MCPAPSPHRCKVFALMGSKFTSQRTSLARGGKRIYKDHFVRKSDPFDAHLDTTELLRSVSTRQRAGSPLCSIKWRTRAKTIRARWSATSVTATQQLGRCRSRSLASCKPSFSRYGIPGQACCSTPIGSGNCGCRSRHERNRTAPRLRPATRRRYVGRDQAYHGAAGW